MGRKGVSKRKPGVSKSKPLAGGAASGSVASALRSADNQPARVMDTSKAAPSAKSGGKPGGDRKKSPKKG